MDLNQDLLSALRFFQEDPNALKVFQSIADQLGSSGWAVARSLDLNPNQTAQILTQLKEKDLVRATEPGLQGNYSLSGLGFTLKEQLKAGRFSR